MMPVSGEEKINYDLSGKNERPNLERRAAKYLLSKQGYLAVAYCVAILTGIIVYIVVPVVDLSFQGKDGDWYRFWFQAAAGNWSSGEDAIHLVNRKTISNIEFAASAIIAVLLNNFLFALILLQIWNLFVQRKRPMHMADALVLKEFYTKEALRKALKADLSEIFNQVGESNFKLKERLDDDRLDYMLEVAFEKGAD